MKRIELYCIEELRRMLDATHQIAALLPDLRERATHPLLKGALDEQLMVNRRVDLALRDIFDLLGADPKPSANIEVAAMANLTRRGFGEPEHLRDVIIAQQAARIENYQVVSFEGLASWFHQLRNHDVADRLDEMSDRLVRAVGHLRDIRASVSSLVKDVPHKYRSPDIARPQDRELRGDLDGYEVF